MIKWNSVLSFVTDPAFSSGVWIVSLIFMAYMHKMYNRQLDDRQKELDRLAADNRQYRDNFAKLMQDYLPGQHNKRDSKNRSKK